MVRRLRHNVTAGILLALSVGGWTLASHAVDPVPQPGQSESRTSGLLDGMTFTSALGPADEPADVEDKLVFENGAFASEECDRRCGYPPAPYYTRRVGDSIEFFSTSRCTYKDATLVWRGKVDNGVIRGTIQWTTERWYWTVEREFWFEGELSEAEKPVANRN